jgi:hypothetical protein
VDHLRWLEFESLSPETVTMRDLSRYMAAVGAEYAGPYGRPWRAGKEPYSQSSLDSAAGLGLLDQALALDLRRPQDYFQRIWAVNFRASDLTGLTDPEERAG